MIKTINSYWWLLAIQGLFLAIVGGLALSIAELEIQTIIEYLGLILLAFGLIMGLIGLRSRKKGGPWVFSAIAGLIQIILGLLILVNPSSSTSIFILIIGVWALAMALVQLIMAFVTSQNRLVFIINSIISSVFGVLIIWVEFEDQRSLTTLVGIYSIVLGITVIYYAIRLRIWSNLKLRLSEAALENESKELENPEVVEDESEENREN